LITRLREASVVPVLRRWQSCVLAAFVSSFTACADPATQLQLPTPDPTMFEKQVYPLLLRDCGFPACHGDHRRFFRVFGPGRSRFPRIPETGLFDPATPEEIELTYYRARSMLANEEGVENSLLLRKSLHADHGGVDEWGRNVYSNETDPGYMILSSWARTLPATGAPTFGSVR
jgi:hypothetical protein